MKCSCPPQKQQLVPQGQAALLLLVPMLSPCNGLPSVRALGCDALHGPFGLHPLPWVGREEIERDGPLYQLLHHLLLDGFVGDCRGSAGRNLSGVGEGWGMDRSSSLCCNSPSPFLYQQLLAGGSLLIHQPSTTSMGPELQPLESPSLLPPA